MINDGNLTLHITHELNQIDAADASIGYGDINIEHHPDCPDFMTADEYGNCECTVTTQHYDANSKQCCDASCSRCLGPDPSECILTLDSELSSNAGVGATACK